MTRPLTTVLSSRAPLVVALTLAGCVTLPTEKFVSSSLDLNLGRPHTVTLPANDVERLSDRLIALAKERELVLVDQEDCGPRRCELAFRGKPVDRRIFRGTGSQTRSYYSRYFVVVREHNGHVRVEGFGLPVLDGTMACPKALEARVKCKPKQLNRAHNATLVVSVRDTWGYDVSGKVEAETLQGMFAELRREPPPAGTGLLAHKQAPPNVPALAGSRRMIVAVFDVKDESGSVAPRTLSQLTEYLAAQVTRVAGYQVVPRDQLRTRLSREKRRSYKDCYDQRCQIELGKAVAAQKSLATKLLRVGNKCALTAMLYDLKSETTERAASAATACSAEELLGGIERLATQLAGGTS